MYSELCHMVILTSSQGCCQSTDRSEYDSAPPPPPATILPNDNGNRASQPSRSLLNAESPRDSSLAPSGNVRPNQPIRPATPMATSPEHVSNQPPPWTRRQLERERDAFFDTRVSGNTEVWKAVRVVCEMLRKGDIAEAQAILDAINMTCPNGRVARGRGRHREKGGLYDERGELYDIPAWIVTDPEDLIEDEGEKDVLDGADSDDGDVQTIDPTATTRRNEKGKGRAEDPGEILQIRARLSDRGTDIIVSAGTKQKIAVIVRGIQDQIGRKRLRLMYLGKTLDERTTLMDSGYKQGHVLNAMVFEGDEKMLSKPFSR